MWWAFAIGQALQWGGTFVNMSMTYHQGKIEQQMAERKAEMLRVQAGEARKTRQLQARSEREQSTKKLAKMEARYAKAGLAITGTPLYAMEEQAEVDEFNILSKSRATEIWAQDREYEAELSEWQGKVARKSATWKMVGQFFGQAGSSMSSGAMMGMGGQSGGGGQAPTGAGYMAQSSYTTSPYGGMQVQQQFSMAS